MELVNETRMTAGYTMAIEPSGRELLVVVVKGTFQIPKEPNALLALHTEQVPLVMSDQFFGEPGLSAPKYEIDFAPRKKRCDVLLNGHAYAPGGRSTQRLTVAVRIGQWSKAFSVVGNRSWFSSGGIGATSPEPFLQMPITYDYAFGGTDLHHEDPTQHAAYTANPSGRGFHRHLKAEWIDGTPLPNTEELGVPIAQPMGTYRPMSFGVIGRHWESRVQYAGTYDQDWMDNVFPFLPADFDEQYYQSAPEDQQLTLPIGEQVASLVNLTPDGRCDFLLPHFEAPIYVIPKEGARESLTAPADTVLIEPDLQRVTMTWRVARPLRKSMFEIAQVLVGRKGSEWWQKRESVRFPVPIVVEGLLDVAPEGDAVLGADAEEGESGGLQAEEAEEGA